MPPVPPQKKSKTKISKPTHNKAPPSPNKQINIVSRYFVSL